MVFSDLKNLIAPRHLMLTLLVVLTGLELLSSMMMMRAERMLVMMISEQKSWKPRNHCNLIELES